MPTSLDIHVASPDELAAAHRNVFDIWSKGLPLEEHIRFRIESPKHRLATWYVGTVDGRVVVSLGCYPITYAYRGRLVPGFSIGSVYTVDEFRGRGFAPQLMQWVEDRCRERGDQIGALYCDINPDYYARMGYELCPSLEGWRRPSEVEIPAGLAYHLEEISAIERWQDLSRLYDVYHGAMPISVARKPDYWRALLERFPEDRFYALDDRKGGWHGYLRINSEGDKWRIVDYALADQSLELAEALYAAAFQLAKTAGVGQLGGWLPDHSSARQFFDLTPRRTEITMLKSLSDDCPLDAEMLELASRFCYIDHV
jgi:GNAT superfamily N-acetyltransferase